ncbi:LmbE family protein [Kutzneria albida DSM 43870]|uniref:LmbE family protein n=2 Tax=Kutzneria TaxID=43356 RepID=W5W5B0_9PSEU|nr:LmbE family protein [Kutzneria albida DSM 43870]
MPVTPPGVQPPAGPGRQSTMTSTPGVLCVHAHPDDEALFTGGLLASCAEQGLRTGVVTCTWQQGDARVEELRRSLEILGAGEPRLLGYRDSGMGGENTFCAAPFDEAVSRLVAHLREFRPEAVVTYDAFGTYGHPDHIRAHRVTLAAAEAANCVQLYPEAGEPWQIGALYLAVLPRSAVAGAWRTLFGGDVPAPGPGVPGVPDEQVALRLDVRPWVDRKWAALLAHESETARGAGAARLAGLPERVRQDLLGTECFLRRDLAPPSTVRTTLF